MQRAPGQQVPVTARPAQHSHRTVTAQAQHSERTGAMQRAPGQQMPERRGRRRAQVLPVGRAPGLVEVPADGKWP